MPTTQTSSSTWQPVTTECYVSRIREGVTWGILEDAPGNWYLYPKPSREVYGPFVSPQAAMDYADTLTCR